MTRVHVSCQWSVVSGREEKRREEKRAARVVEGTGSPCRATCRTGRLRPWLQSVAGSIHPYYGSDNLDASLLMIPLIGFLPPTDERVRATVELIQEELMVDGFVLRYHPNGSTDVDGLPPGEGSISAFFILAGRLLVSDGTACGSARAFPAFTNCWQQYRPAFGRIRCQKAPAGWQSSASLRSRRTH
jgi:hypothetical protein